MPEKKLKVRKKRLAVSVYDIKGKKTGTTSLPKEIFGVKINPQLMAQAVRVYLANQRKGTAQTKTRGQVVGSTRKIYRQKGTGRARHGSIRAPIFVHGGVAFGPKPRDYSLSLPKKMRRRALCSSLTSKREEGAVRIVAKLATITPKTKEMAAVLSNLGTGRRETVLIITPERIENVQRAARNLEGVRVSPAWALTPYTVLCAKTLVFMEEAIPILEQTFGKGT